MHSGKVRENLRRRWAILKLKIKEKAKIAQYLLIRKTPRSQVRLIGSKSQMHG
jgi:hypothetical protein